MKQIWKIFTITSLLLFTLLFATGAAFANEDGGGRPGRPGPGHARGHSAHGTVTTVGADSLTLLTPSTRTITATVSASTTIYLVQTGISGTLSDITVGDRVHVHGQRVTTGTIAAKRIVVEPDGDQVRGKVTAVDGATITLQTHKESRRTRHSEVVTATFTVSVTDLTQFRTVSATATLNDVVVGKHIVAYGTLQGDNALDATLVIIGKANERRPGQGGPGHGHGNRPANILDRQAIKAAIAEALGMTVAELDAAKEAGKTLAQLAEEKGITLEDIEEAAKAAAIEQINQAVVDGKLTQEEADTWITRINNSDFPGCGGGRGERGGHPNTSEDADDLADTDGVTVRSAAAPAVSFAVKVFLPSVWR